MNLSSLPRLNEKSKKRIGRGYGSGRGGHTSTRGSKGQKARGDIGLFFEGTKLKKSWLKRLPLLRGKGKLKPAKVSFGINIGRLNLFKENEVVDIESLKAKGLLPKSFSKNVGVKILGEGELKVPLTIALPCSAGALKKIEKAGGKILKEELKKELKTKTQKKETLKKKG